MALSLLLQMSIKPLVACLEFLKSFHLDLIFYFEDLCGYCSSIDWYYVEDITYLNELNDHK